MGTLHSKCSACGLYVCLCARVQGSGATAYPNLQYHQCIYWAAVTITTVGYGASLPLGCLSWRANMLGALKTAHANAAPFCAVWQCAALIAVTDLSALVSMLSTLAACTVWLVCLDCSHMAVRLSLAAGDYAPTTWLTQLLQVGLLALTFTLLPFLTSSLVEALSSTSAYQRKRWAIWVWVTVSELLHCKCLRVGR